MDSNTKPLGTRIDELLFKQRTCTSCSLHINRKTLLVGNGSVVTDVVAVVDRVSPRAAVTGNLYSGGEGKFLSTLFLRAGMSPTALWVTPVVSCPTGSLVPTKGRIDMLPAPKKIETSACSPRLHQEIHLIEPSIIFAFGTTSVTALSPKAKFTEVRGRVSEATIQGDLVHYPVPMMALPSINQLYRNPTQAVGGVWHKTLENIQEGLDIALTLSELRRNHG